jgi:hypothetical protein
MNQKVTLKDPLRAMSSNSYPDDSRYWEALNRITTHEAMCEERSKTIFNRLDRIDGRLDAMSRQMFMIGFTIICSMAGLIVTLLLK